MDFDCYRSIKPKPQHPIGQNVTYSNTNTYKSALESSLPAKSPASKSYSQHKQFLHSPNIQIIITWIKMQTSVLLSTNGVFFALCSDILLCLIDHGCSVREHKLSKRLSVFVTRLLSILSFLSPFFFFFFFFFCLVSSIGQS